MVQGGVKTDMEDRQTQFTANDMGLVAFILVAGWLLLFQSGIFG